MSLPDDIKVKFVDANELAYNTNPALLALIITHEEIQAQNIASVLERLLILTDTPENVKMYRNSVVIQIAGYDDDPRELPEIREVRSYFRMLEKEWPYWFWFLLPGVGAISLLLSLLCEVRVIRTSQSAYGTEFLNTDELSQTLLNLVNRAVPLLSASGVNTEEIDIMVSAVLDELGIGKP